MMPACKIKLAMARNPARVLGKTKKEEQQDNISKVLVANNNELLEMARSVTVLPLLFGLYQ